MEEIRSSFSEMAFDTEIKECIKQHNQNNNEIKK